MLTRRVSIRYDTASIACFAVLAVLGGWFVSGAFTLPGSLNDNDPGPAYLPVVLGGLMIGLCVIGIVRSALRRSAERLVLPQVPLIAAVVAGAAVFLAVWSVAEVFHAPLFVLLMVWLGLLRDGAPTRRTLAVDAVLSGVIVLSVHVVFGVLMAVDF